MKNKQLLIAIDGPAGVGKTSVGKSHPPRDREGNQKAEGQNVISQTY